MKRKYGNRKTVIDGHTFDSKREAARYGVLKLLERTGTITDLELQPRFELIPKQRRDDGRPERACEYVADFRYTDTRTGQTVIEDAKGMRTRDYIVKRKLMLQVHGISVREV
ncbi:DUF1064 domain-containing protein [Alcaligenes nematophilus]|uniref:DUF1064 domain-containing protein n=1 Tax=Alcaligenes faecalis TaxID=511 RepID=UPI001033A3D3|nr:DUF1064 domain-containing protein [Alcaligenes faecalis]MBH0311276.1 DUF1064 domain-containing protein [Alcaligenes faecalis]QBH21048.1 DUF1064 domain-containing protein [Alcaligenes faecalis]